MFDEVIFHIGAHKTGTTAIQDWCFANSDLLEEQGVHYPTGVLSRWHGHHEIAWTFGVSHPFKEPNLDVCAEIENLYSVSQPRLLISSEDLEYLLPDGIGQLKARFPARNYRVIIFFRNVIDYLFADYQQNVRMEASKYTRPVSEFFVEMNFYYRANYFQIASQWADVFGDAEMRVLCYESAKSGGLLESFCEAAALSLPSDGLSSPSSNRSLNPLSVETLRRINARALLKECARDKIIAHLYQLEANDRRDIAFMDGALCARILGNLSHPLERLPQRFSFDIAKISMNTQADRTLFSEEEVCERLFSLLAPCGSEEKPSEQDQG